MPISKEFFFKLINNEIVRIALQKLDCNFHLQATPSGVTKEPFSSPQICHLNRKSITIDTHLYPIREGSEGGEKSKQWRKLRNVFQQIFISKQSLDSMCVRIMTTYMFDVGIWMIKIV